MKNIIKRFICIAFACSLALLSMSSMAAAKPKISSTKRTVTAGKTITLKIFNANKEVKWSTSKSKVAKIKTISGKNNYRVKIKAIKNGKATITAKVGSKKFKCKITVKKKTSVYKSSGTTVYVTNTGEKYHLDGCTSLRRSKIEISLSSAKEHGYEPCNLCHPPT